MKLNGMLILILVAALATVTAVAWTAGEDRPVCPVTGEPTACTGDGPHGPHGLAGPHHRSDLMAAALDLTEEQREAVREIIDAGRDAARVRMETALTGILTPEQLGQFGQIKARRESWGDDAGRPGRMGRMGRTGPMGGDREEMASRRLERMTAHLDLTPDQQDQIRQILEEAAPPPRSEVRDKIRAVLTPEQQEKMEQLPRYRPGLGNIEGKGPMNGRNGRVMGRDPRAGGPADRGMGFAGRLAEQLQLTDEQREAARGLMTEIRDQQRAETRSRIEALLTVEQREKLEQLHQN